MTTTNKKLKGNGQKKPVRKVQKMQPSLQLLPLIMDNIPQAVFWKDRELIYLGCNQAFAEDAGLASPEEIVGKTDYDMPWKDQAELYRADDCLVMEQGKPKLNYEEPQTTPSGSVTWLRTSKIPVREGGKIVAVLGMYEDITEYKKAQEAALGEKQRFQTILETIRVPTIISRLSDGQVLYANQAIAQISQVNLDKLIGFKTGSFYVNPGDQEKVRQALRTSGHIEDLEVQFQRTDGSRYWALLSSRIINYEGETCVLSSYVDISTRKQVEAALKVHDEFSEKQSTAFAELARSKALYSGDLQAAFGEVTEAAARTLNIQRASIWYYSDDHTEIRCMDLFEQGKGHSAGIVLGKADFPAYFKALEDERVIAADNAHTDPATHEFSASYLTPLGINSMLDAPIRLRGEVIGVICNEHVGPFRQWSVEEQNFARTIVDFVTVAVETQERKQTETELQQSEVKLSSALHVANMGHWEFDVPTGMFTFNDQYYSLHGTTAQQAGGYQMSAQRFAQEFVYPEDAGTVGQTIQQALESTDPNFQLQTEARILRNGEPRWVTVWFRVERDVQGHPVKLHGVNQDITERKQAEDAVREANARVQAVLDAATQEAIIATDPNGLLTVFNTGAEQMLGYSAKELVGKQTPAIFHVEAEVVARGKELTEEFGHLIQGFDVFVEYARQGRFEEREWTYVRKDGEHLTVNLVVTALRNSRGEITGFLGIARDITERKKAEEALRESEARYSAVVTQATDGIVIIQDNILQFVNETMGKLMGYSASEMMNTPIISYIAPESRELIVNRIKARLAGEEVPNIYEAKLQRKDGTLIDAELSAGTIEYRGRPADVGMIRDITERKQIEQTLRDTEVIYSAVVTQAKDGVVIIQDNVLKFVNQSMSDMLGYTLPEFENTRFIDYVVSENKPMVLNRIKAHLDGEDVPTRYEIGLERKDGTSILAELSAGVKEYQGRSAYVAMIRDISERKQAEETLLESEEKFRRFTETTSEALIFHEQDRIVDANPAAFDMFGVSEDEFLGEDLLQFIAPESRAIVLRQSPTETEMPYDAKYIPEHSEYIPTYDDASSISVTEDESETAKHYYEIQCLRKDGSTFPAELSTYRYAVGDRILRVTSIRDITERKQAEQTLQQSEANLSSALHVANMGHWEFDVPTGMFTFNDQYYSLHGTTAQQVGGYQMSAQRFAQEFVYPEDAGTVGQTIQQALESTDPNFQLQTEARILRNGEPRWVTVWFRVERDVKGHPVKLHGVNQDIHERKQLEQQIQTALERRGLQVQLSTQISQSIATASSLEELYERVVTQIKEQFNYYHTQLLRYDAAQEAVMLVNGYGETGAKMLAAGHRLPIGEGLIGTAAATGQTVLRPVLENDPDWRPNPLLPETKGEIAVPIKLGDTVLGVLDVQSSVAGALDADDQLLLEGLCGQIATAFESTRLSQEMAERLEEINRLYRAMSHEGWQTYRQSADRPTGFMFDQAGLRPVPSTGLAEELFAQVPLTVPGGEVIGTLAIADDPERPLTSEEEAFLQQVSEQLSLALESARLFEQTEEQRGQLNEALEIAKLANWEYDVNRDRFIFNDHFYSIFHTTAEQVGGYEISSAEYAERFVYPDDRPMVGEEIGKALSSTDRHYNVQLEHRILFADGGIGYISVNVHIERDEQGRITRYYGANQDITDRKRAEEAIAKRAAELETVATVSTAASTVLDPDQLLQSVVNLTKERFNLYHAHVYLANENKDALVLTAGAGEVGKQMLAEEWSIPVAHELSIIADAYRKQQSVVANDIHHDKDSVFLSNRLLPDTRSEMAIPLLVGDQVLGVFDVQSAQVDYFTAEDINIYTTLSAQVAVALQNARLYVDQAALVTQLRELDKLKSSFLANMSHELRTPLNSILGFADVIIEELDGPLTENMNNDLRLIQKNGQHLLHLINDVLDMAKIEAGRMNLSPETFTAYEVLEEVTSITSTLASEKHLSLFIQDEADKEVKIYADRTRLRQVMINLVNNSIKFTETGKISLNLVTIPGARILISVKDTGIGIPPDKLEPIFQEFTQVDASTTRKAGGTGLGLPISRRLVEMHGGRLWAESTGVPGEGSTFYVELPIEARITETIEKQVK